MPIDALKGVIRKFVEETNMIDLRKQYHSESEFLSGLVNHFESWIDKKSGGKAPIPDKDETEAVLENFIAKYSDKINFFRDTFTDCMFSFYFANNIQFNSPVIEKAYAFSLLDKFFDWVKNGDESPVRDSIMTFKNRIKYNQKGDWQWN